MSQKIERSEGIGPDYAETLGAVGIPRTSELPEAAGADTTRELRNRNTENLTEKMDSVNADKNLVRQTPVAKTVAGWISQAKELPPVVTY